jgi:hypothetical protein
MCYCTAELFFGLFVRSADLLIAALAWKDLEPTFLAVDMICSKRGSQTLRVEGHSRVADVPGEVWDAIEDELVCIAVEEEGRELSKFLRCGVCEGAAKLPADFRELFTCTNCY